MTSFLNMPLNSSSVIVLSFLIDRYVISELTEASIAIINLHSVMNRGHLSDDVSEYRTSPHVLFTFLREEHRLRVFENRVPRRIIGPKRDEVTGGWRKLHNEELHGLYSSPSIIRVIKTRRMRWAGHVARMGEVRGAYNILVGRPEGRRPLGRPRRRWENNIKMDLREIGFGDMDWIHWAQDRDRWRALVNTVMNLRVP
jgi:hypothetical protein